MFILGFTGIGFIVSEGAGAIGWLICEASLRSIARAAAFLGSRRWRLDRSPAGVSANGGDVDGPRGTDVPLAANHSSCKDFRARSSGNLRSDRTGRTSPDWE
jgi:hypothetical protein